MIRRTVARRLALAAALVVATPLAAAAQFSSLTFFGDSFTDTGNGDILSLGLLGVDLTPSPPYATGVISNGANWAQLLAAALGQPGDAAPALLPLAGRNFAIGTARTGLTGASVPPFGPLPIGMLTQLAIHNGTCGFGPAVCPPALPADPTGLYAIFGGANDIDDAGDLGTPAARTAALNLAVTNIATLATALYGAGARSFLVPNVPNVGLTPENVASGNSALLAALTDEFNALLGARLALLGATLPGSTFYGLRLDTLFENILADAGAGGALYGITNTTIPCFAPGAPSCAVSAFVDLEGHPTTAAHQLIAEAAFNRVVLGVDVTAIPEPSTVALLAGGLAVLAFGARRKLRA